MSKIEIRRASQIHAGVWKCGYCGTLSIQIGDELGSSKTQCPKGCPGNFSLVKRYPLATQFEGIKESFEREMTKFFEEMGNL